MYFCFKQKTAYEMRISDWSSDVCSSDLGDGEPRRYGFPRYHARPARPGGSQSDLTSPLPAREEPGVGCEQRERPTPAPQTTVGQPSALQASGWIRSVGTPSRCVS